MAVSKAQQASVNKYVKSNYDRINVTMPKGEKEVIQGYAAAQGESVNGFIVRAVRERIERDDGGVAAPGAAPAERVLAETASTSPQRPAEVTTGAESIPLPSDTLEVAQRAAEAVGETIPVFVARAVETQAQRDATARKLGSGK